MGYGTDILAEAKPAITMYHQVQQAIWKRHGLSGPSDERVLHDLSLGERAFILAHEFFAMYSEGGYDSYFFEGEGYRRAHEAVRVFRRVGLVNMAEFLSKAIEAAGIPEPVPLDYEYESPEDGFDEIESAYRKVRRSESLEETLVSYFKQHADEFV